MCEVWFAGIALLFIAVALVPVTSRRGVPRGSTP
jgi:hypothetical protein